MQILWLNNVGKTQTTCEMSIDGNISGAESGIVFEDDFYTMDADTSYMFEELKPGYEHAFYYGIKLRNGSLSRHECLMVMTAGVDPAVTLTGMTPDTFSAMGSYVEDDAVVTETGFTGYETDGETISLQDLEPNTQYTVEYYVVASDVKYTTEYTFTTPDVEFTTFPAKEASNTVVLLCATTNLSDNAMGAGYEWRRSDAPDLIPSTQAECPIIDGELTGALMGLTPNTYYLFRPYYTSLGGVTYYGDWAAFITAAEYVYFAPTVRTYEPMSVDSVSATVKAYAVAGSDDITSQGFEYWVGGSFSAMHVKMATTTYDNGVTRIEVSGQWMTATLEDLEPSTTYSYRAYVTTEVGTTYGETISFTTDLLTAPTVRTNAAENVTSSSATLSGEVTAGKDEILEQGFELWEDGSGEVMTITTTGEDMSVEVEGLNASTMYTYRAYARSASGTEYGDEVSFTTLDDVEMTIGGVNSEREEVARYTTDGKKISQPQRGMNVVVYSDGSVKKVLVK